MEYNKEHIFTQLSIYSDQINKWEEMLKTGKYEPGQHGEISLYIKKNRVLIDTLLDRYNKNKSQD